MLYGKADVQAQFIKEADSMRALNHRHIIRLYGIVLSAPLMLVRRGLNNILVVRCHDIVTMTMNSDNTMATNS